jgi:hypothetical protein
MAVNWPSALYAKSTRFSSTPLPPVSSRLFDARDPAEPATHGEPY